MNGYPQQAGRVVLGADNTDAGTLNGSLYADGFGKLRSIKANFVGTAAPAVTDDASKGYTVGSKWFDQTNHIAYDLLDDTIGAALWKTSSSTGEANTASNAGSAGVGPYDSKVGVNLLLRNIVAGSSKLSVALDSPNKNIDIDVNEANLTLSNMGGSLGVAQGGTALSTVTTGGILYGSASNVYSVLAANGSSTRGFLRSVSGGSPAWDTLVSGDLPAHTHAASDIVSGSLAAQFGGTGKSSLTRGAILYANGLTSFAEITPNASATVKFLTQSGDGTTPAAPAYTDTIANSSLDVVNSSPGSFTSANITVNAQGRVTVAANGSSGFASAGAGQLAVYTGTNTIGGTGSGASYGSSALTLGNVGGISGQLILTGATSGAVTIAAPTSGASYELLLPQTAGEVDQPILNGGAGAMSWGRVVVKSITSVDLATTGATKIFTTPAGLKFNALRAWIIITAASSAVGTVQLNFGYTGPNYGDFSLNVSAASPAVDKLYTSPLSGGGISAAAATDIYVDVFTAYSSGSATATVYLEGFYY